MPADGDRLEVFEADDGWRWRRVAANNRILCSGEAHDREDHAQRAAYRSCPDLDPAWLLVPAGPRVSLDAVDRLLAASSEAERDEARAKLLGQMP